ncbi:MAG: MFS transporter [Theionarchaea archaeon]|nr:MFS transporter [Theionarchaea archaeon]
MHKVTTEFTILFKYKNYLELCFAVLVSMIGFGLIIPLLPIYGREMGASGFYLGLLTSLFAITRAMTSFPGGFLADKIGRKKLIAGGLFVYTIVMFLFGISTNLYHLFILRACQGAASGIVWPVAATMVADIVEPKDRGKAMGFFTMMWDAGIAIGPVLGGFLTVAFSIAVPFFVCSAFALISALLIVWRVEETLSQEDRAMKSSPSLSLSIDRFSLLGISITGFAMAFALGLVHPLISLFGDEVLGLNEAAIGLIFGVMGVTRFLVKAPSGVIADRIGRKIVALGGFLINGIFTVAITLSQGLVSMLFFTVIRAIGLGMTMPSINALVTSLTSKENRGKVMGIYSTARNGGLIVGPLLGAMVFDTVSKQSPFYLCGAVVFVAALIMMVTVREESPS